MALIKISRLCKEIGVVPQTIYNWYKKGLIELDRTPTGQYYITEENYNYFFESKNKLQENEREETI